MIKLLAILAATYLALCNTAVAQEATRFVLTPEIAFSGHTEGNGTLDLIVGSKEKYHVESVGVVQPDGRFRLDQEIVFAGKPSRARTWLITQAAPLHYSGTLSDAAGTVSGETQGRILTLCYRIKGPLFMHQTLEMMADGKTIDNVGRITLFGIPVGHLQETITRKGQ